DRLREEDVPEVAAGSHRLTLELACAPRVAKTEVAAGARHVGQEIGMEPDRKPQLLRGPPDRLVDLIVELSLSDRRVGAHEDPHQAAVPGVGDLVERQLDSLVQAPRYPVQ